jgi:hypothetical protein
MGTGVVRDESPKCQRIVISFLLLCFTIRVNARRTQVDAVFLLCPSLYTTAKVQHDPTAPWQSCKGGEGDDTGLAARQGDDN